MLNKFLSGEGRVQPTRLILAGFGAAFGLLTSDFCPSVGFSSAGFDTQKTFNGNIFIQKRPVNADTVPDQPVFIAFHLSGRA